MGGVLAFLLFLFFSFCMKRKNLPGGIDAGRFGLVESRGLVALVEPDYQCADAKGSNTATLGIPLLHTGDVFGDVLDRHGVFHRQPVTLRFQSRLVNQDPCVGVEARERQTHMCVDQTDLGRRDACVLQLHGRPLLATQHDDVGAFDPHRAGPPFDGFERIFHLEDVPVGTGREELVPKDSGIFHG